MHASLYKLIVYVKVKFAMAEAFQLAEMPIAPERHVIAEG